jgi:hypothetical protein
MTEREFFNNNAVEVDGIRFEIFVSRMVVVVPVQSKPKSNHDTSVKLYIRITNNRSNSSYCFTFHHNFVPENSSRRSLMLDIKWTALDILTYSLSRKDEVSSY